MTRDEKTDLEWTMIKNNFKDFCLAWKKSLKEKNVTTVLFTLLLIMQSMSFVSSNYDRLNFDYFSFDKEKISFSQFQERIAAFPPGSKISYYEKTVSNKFSELWFYHISSIDKKIVFFDISGDKALVENMSNQISAKILAHHMEKVALEKKIGKIDFFGILLSIFLFFLFGVLYLSMIGMSSGYSFFSIFSPMLMENTVDQNKQKITLNDIIGIDEIKAEVKKYINTMNNIESFEKLKLRAPKGLLLYGPPGVGKTLIAKAIAGESDLPFFQVAAPELVSSFVGGSSSKIRQLFKNARSSTKGAVIFIDEIDAIGGARSTGDERNQAIMREMNSTVNTLLAEMDGFKNDPTRPILVIAATNHKDQLDSALIRAGRFDSHILVPLPSVTGREQMFKFYLSKIPHAIVDYKVLARRTPDFSGASIETMVNEAAMICAEAKEEMITIQHLEEARMKYMMGPLRKADMNPELVKRICIHELGHAVAALVKCSWLNVDFITCQPRGHSLGQTLMSSEEDRQLLTRSQLQAEIMLCLGGMAAEKELLGETSTGAGQDLKQAYNLAGSMVSYYGMGQNNRMYASSSLAYTNRASEKDMVEAEKIVNDCFIEIEAVMSQHRETLAEYATKLQTALVLDETDIKTLKEKLT